MKIRDFEIIYKDNKIVEIKKKNIIIYQENNTFYNRADLLNYINKIDNIIYELIGEKNNSETLALAYISFFIIFGFLLIPFSFIKLIYFKPLFYIIELSFMFLSIDKVIDTIILNKSINKINEIKNDEFIKLTNSEDIKRIESKEKVKKEIHVYSQNYNYSNTESKPKVFVKKM